MRNKQLLIGVTVLFGVAVALVAARVILSSGHSSPSTSAAAPASPSTPTSSSTTADLPPTALVEAPVLPAVLPTPEPTPQVKQLALLTFTCSVVPESITCTGSVKNLTDQPLSNVVALVQYADENYAPVGQAAAPIADTPIMPGQTSSWTVVSNPNAAFTYERVLFAAMPGGALFTLEDDTG